jgi:hypothetical protein
MQLRTWPAFKWDPIFASALITGLLTAVIIFLVGPLTVFAGGIILGDVPRRTRKIHREVE